MNKSRENFGGVPPSLNQKLLWDKLNKLSPDQIPATQMEIKVNLEDLDPDSASPSKTKSGLGSTQVTINRSFVFNR